MQRESTSSRTSLAWFGAFADSQSFFFPNFFFYDVVDTFSLDTRRRRSLAFLEYQWRSLATYDL